MATVTSVVSRFPKTYTHWLGKGQNEQRPFIRSYPKGMEMSEHDHLAVGSGVLERYEKVNDVCEPFIELHNLLKEGLIYRSDYEFNRNRMLKELNISLDTLNLMLTKFKKVGDQWTENMAYTKFEDCDIDYLMWLLTKNYEVSKLIAEWKVKTPEGQYKFSNEVFPSRETGWMYRTYGSFIKHKEKRDSFSETSESGLFGKTENYIDNGQDSWYIGAEFIKGDYIPDYDPSPWTVTGMDVEDENDLVFKAKNLLPVELPGGLDDWKPAPWQAYNFINHMKKIGGIEVIKSKNLNGEYMIDGVLRNVVNGCYYLNGRKRFMKTGYYIKTHINTLKFINPRTKNTITYHKKTTIQLPSEWMVSSTFITNEPDSHVRLYKYLKGNERFIKRHVYDHMMVTHVALQNIYYSFKGKAEAVVLNGGVLEILEALDKMKVQMPKYEDTLDFEGNETFTTKYGNYLLMMIEKIQDEVEEIAADINKMMKENVELPEVYDWYDLTINILKELMGEKIVEEEEPKEVWAETLPTTPKSRLVSFITFDEKGEKIAIHGTTPPKTKKRLESRHLTEGFVGK